MLAPIVAVRWGILRPQHQTLADSGSYDRMDDCAANARHRIALGIWLAEFAGCCQHGQIILRDMVMVFWWFSKKADAPRDARSSIPTVRFDASFVTDAIRADLWERIQEFEDLPVGEEETVYEAALLGVTRGRDSHVLYKALTEMGMPTIRASYITRYLIQRSSALMDVARSRSLGLKEGKWLYSGAACYSTNSPSNAEISMDAAHRAANGEVFRLDKGMKVNGQWTFPGLEPGCKCVTNAVVPGFN